MELTVDQALQQGVAAHKEGKLQDAERLYRAILQAQPKHPDANHNLGVLAVAVGKPIDAIPLFKLALETNPQVEQFWLSYIDVLITVERFDEANRVLVQGEKAGLSSDKLDAFKPRLGGRATNDTKKVAPRAEPSQDQINRLVEHYQTGSLEEAKVLATLLTQQFPKHPAGWKALGIVLKQTGRLAESLAPMQSAVTLSPQDAEAHSNLGVTLKELGRLDEAEASYRQAIALKPDLAEAHCNLCELLEKTNAIDTLLLVLENARANINSMEADLLYYETLAFFRTERYAEAGALITRITEGDLSEGRKAPYLKLKGDLLHRSQDYDAAFLCYKNSNLTVKTGAEYRNLEIAADRYFEVQRNTGRQLAELSMGGAYPNRLSSDVRQPTFLVGFPRSGTTLLDTILRTHSKINVVEEQPMLKKMHSALGGLRDLSAIEALDESDLSLASNAYFEELERHTDWTGESLAIDKLPLNLLKAPLIHQVFPEAKFILALRHPFDCILSCWMQTFKLNMPMANMVDLDRIVDFYCVAMDIFHLSQRRYGLDVHRIRYEDLIEDFEAETTSILKFLGLEWESELVNYQATALTRRKINTPSHSQVIKPIYKAASFRWKHYENHLVKYKPKLAPWFEEYGY